MIHILPNALAAAILVSTPVQTHSTPLDTLAHIQTQALASKKADQPRVILNPVYTYTGTTPAVTEPVTREVAAVVAYKPTPSALTDEQIVFLGSCEAGMDPAKNTGNGYYGAFQFTIGTWNAMQTGYERADLAPLSVQIAAVKSLLSRSSIWSQFPGCAAKMRAAGLLS